MESTGRADLEQEWRLGSEPEPTLRAERELPLQPPPDPSRERLQRAIHVVTAEELAWVLIAAWALLTRLAAVGARPLTAGEAGNALFAYDFANRTSEAGAGGLYPDLSGWVRLVEGGIFALFGSNDFTARIFFVLSGLLLVAMAYALRSFAGRAGAIAIGAMLAISPSVTWFSRSATSVICAASLALVTIALFMALKARPTRRRATALGLGAGLLMSADPMGVVTTVIFVTALGIIGLFELLTISNAYLRTRVWLERYGGLAGSVVLIAIAIYFLSVLGGSDIADAIGCLISPRWANLAIGFHAVVLPLGFYDFLIVIAGAAGIVGVGLIRTRFAFFCLLWTVQTYLFYLSTPYYIPEQIVMMLVPSAVLGGFAIDYVHHHTSAWRKVRYPIVALILLSIHAQSLTNFADSAPDATEAPWQRRANLFWSEGATTLQAVERCTWLQKGVSPENATVFNDGDWPAALRWYLRGLRPVNSRDAAWIVVDANGSPTDEDAATTSHIDFEESWNADPDELTLKRALLYFFTQRAWGEVTTHSAIIVAGPQQAGTPRQ
jgi:predicted membrane-bound mannosyltransferase